jgi:ligand-binding SRPBCC domain-containing protein
MADYVVETRMWLARPRADVFAFLADPATPVRVTPPRFRLRLLEPVPAIEAGSVLEYRLTWLGVPLRWRAFIREYDPPFRFVDVQVRGPFARWEHRHRFLEEEGGTWVEDRVTYRLPFGPLGRLAHALLVRRQLDRMWLQRQRRIGELLVPAAAARA